MPKKFYIIPFLLNLVFFASSIELVPDFLKKTDSQVLKDIFSCKIGIMQLKNVGKYNIINPLDSQNVVNTIKNNLDMVPTINLTEKSAVLKAFYIYKSKLSDSEKNNIQLLERKLLNSDNDIDNSLIYDFFLLLKNNNQFFQIAKQWFENYNNPFYTIQITKPFQRISKEDNLICEMDSFKINDTETAKGKLDFLFSGTIEKIDGLYFINIYVFSYYDNKIISSFSFVSDSQSISKKINIEIEKIIPQIFLTKYASLKITTNDKDARIYIDSNYIGKENETINYLVPGRYIVILKKENYIDKVENVYLTNYEKKEIELKIDTEKELQIVNFYIEPLGTKIFINSVFQGRSPFKKALPKGNYIISAKNNLYEDYRYYLNINDIQKEELNIVFHLKSKKLKNYFDMKKSLYYASFWNFTFSLITTVPVLIFAYDYFYKYGQAQSSYNTINNISIENNNLDKQYRYTEEGKTMYILQSSFYGLAWGFGFYSILSIGWMFFSLFDYLNIKEQQDFIPIIEFYQNNEGDKSISIGIKMKI